MSVAKRKSLKGFTLIELMIVVAIIGILAAVAVPKFADLVTKSKESAVKGALGATRSAVSIYYGDTEGTYPGNLFDGLTNANKYMPGLGGNPSLGKYEIPKNSTGNPGHTGGFFTSASAAGSIKMDAAIADSAGEALRYFSPANAIAGQSAGDTMIACTHTDTKSVGWTTY